MTTTTLLPPISKSAVFPATSVRACLLKELIEVLKSDGAIKGIALPANPVDIAKTPFPIDSLVVVSILCAVEQIVGFELPEQVVRSGGYSSVEHALGHLLPKIEEHWNKTKGSKP